MADEKKSVTIRLDEPDLVEWAASQSAAVASIRMAVKICILQYGKDVDLLDAILRAQFGNDNNVRPTSEKSHNTSVPKKTISEHIESDNSQNNVGQEVAGYPQSNSQSGNPVGNQQNQLMPNQVPNQQMGNQNMNPNMGAQMGQGQMNQNHMSQNQMNQNHMGQNQMGQQMPNQQMMNPQMGNPMMGNSNQQMQNSGVSASLSSLL